MVEGHTLSIQLRTAAIETICVDRKSQVLTSSTLACLEGVATVNLTQGCAHRCAYCYSRGYSNYPGDNRIEIFANTVEKLRGELRRKHNPPHAVYFSPSSDLFQPVPELRDLAFEVLSLLLRSQIRVSFLTKGTIPPKHMELLISNAPLVSAQIGLITTDDSLCRQLEPHAAMPAERVAQARALSSCGIETTGRIDPIIPHVTDDSETFERVCHDFAAAGIRFLAASVLFLRPAVAKALRSSDLNQAACDRLFAAFQSRVRLPIHARKSCVTALPAETRNAILDRLRIAASAHDITVRACACKNPDIASRACRIAGRAEGIARSRQMVLFD